MSIKVERENWEEGRGGKRREEIDQSGSFVPS